MTLKSIGGAALAFSLLLAEAQAGDGGVVTSLVENDYFGGSDEGYTNGVKLLYLSPEGRGRRLAALALFAGPDDKVRYGVAAGQSIFTPENTSAIGPLPDQQPYAGWLYLEATSLVERRSGAIDILKISAGVVGPSALGEEAQDFVHEVTGSPEIFGWDNQLRDEPGLLVSLDRLWRPLRPGRGVGFDFRPHAGVSVGNILTEARAGALIAFGTRLDTAPPPARISPAPPSAGHHSADGFSWRVFAGAQGRLIARNIFLDGNSWRDSLSVEKNHLVGEFHGGLALEAGRFAVTYTHVVRTKEFETHPGRSDFGAVTVSAAF